MRGYIIKIKIHSGWEIEDFVEIIFATCVWYSDRAYWTGDNGRPKN